MKLTTGLGLPPSSQGRPPAAPDQIGGHTLGTWWDAEDLSDGAVTVWPMTGGAADARWGQGASGNRPVASAEGTSKKVSFDNTAPDFMNLTTADGTSNQTLSLLNMTVFCVLRLPADASTSHVLLSARSGTSPLQFRWDVTSDVAAAASFRARSDDEGAYNSGGSAALAATAANQSAPNQIIPGQWVGVMGYFNNAVVSGQDYSSALYVNDVRVDTSDDTSFTTLNMSQLGRIAASSFAPFGGEVSTFGGIIGHVGPYWRARLAAWMKERVTALNA